MHAAPELHPSQLDFGSRARLPASAIHPALANRGRLAHYAERIKATSKSHFTGSFIGTRGTGDDSLFETMRKLNEEGGNTLLKGWHSADIVADSCLGGAVRAQFVSFRSKEMRQKIANLTTSMQTDTIEGFVESVHYQGLLNLTVTSAWDVVLDTQVPLVITILFRKKAHDYKEHWNTVLSACKGNNAKDFIERFPGNCSDYSDSLKNGFIQSFEHMMRTEKQEDKPCAVLKLQACGASAQCTTKGVFQGETLTIYIFFSLF